MKYTNLEFPSITLASGLSEANVLNIIQQALELNIQTIVLTEPSQNLVSTLQTKFPSVNFNKLFNRFICDESPSPKIFQCSYRSISLSSLNKLNSLSDILFYNIEIDKSFSKSKLIKALDISKNFNGYTICNPIIFPDIDSPLNIYDSVIHLICNHSNKYLLLEKKHLKTSLIQNHPCNIHACSGNSCHEKKSGLPTQLFIDNKLQLYADNELFLGELTNNLLYEILLDKKEYYLSMLKSVYSTYVLNHSYNYFPLAYYIHLLHREGFFEKKTC